MKKSILKRSSNKFKSRPKHFFKKKEKLSQPLKFPNIIRIFTDKFFLASLVSLALLAAFVFVSLNLYNNIKDQQKTDKERKEIIYKIQYWQGIVNEYKDYRDAYFQLAILEYRLKNFDKAKSYLNKTLLIDPNFQKGRELEKILNTK